MSKGKSICVKVYLKPELFAEMVQEAEKAGIRRKGLLLYTQKPHGFSDQKLANTDDIPAFLKYCYSYFRKAEPQRLQEAVKLLQEEQALQKRKQELGLG